MLMEMQRNQDDVSGGEPRNKKWIRNISSMLKEALAPAFELPEESYSGAGNTSFEIQPEFRMMICDDTFIAQWY